VSYLIKASIEQITFYLTNLKRETKKIFEKRRAVELNKSWREHYKVQKQKRKINQAER